jgi:hypothetical protein
MDTKAISKAAKKLAYAETRLARLVANEDAAIEKAKSKYAVKITTATTAVTDAKSALQELVAVA